MPSTNYEHSRFEQNGDEIMRPTEWNTLEQKQKYDAMCKPAEEHDCILGKTTAAFQI